MLFPPALNERKASVEYLPEFPFLRSLAPSSAVSSVKPFYVPGLDGFRQPLSWSAFVGGGGGGTTAAGRASVP